MSSGSGPRIVKNAIILIVVEVLSKVLGMAVIVIAARRLGVTNFGLLAFAYAFTEIFGMVVMFGFDTLIIREVARDESRAPRLMGNVFMMQATLAGLSFLIMALALHILGTEGTRLWLAYVVGLSTILNACLTSLNAFFRARQSVEYEAVVRFSFSALRAILISAVLLMGYGVVTYALAEVLTYVACVLLCLYLVQHRVARPSFVIDLRAWLNTLRAALPFALMGGIVILYVRADTVILSLLRGDEVTGLYSAATKLMILFAFVPTSVVGAVLPAMSKQFVEGESRVAKIYALTFRFMFMLGLPIALGIGLLADPIVHLLYGAPFAPSVPAVQIMMCALLLSFLNVAADSALISINRETALLRIAAIGLAFTVVVNVFLVLNLSYIGASIAATLTEAVVLVLKFTILRRQFGTLPAPQGVGRIVLSGLVMAVFLLTFRCLSIFILVVPAAVIYVTALWLLQAIDKQEMGMVWAALPAGLRRRMPAHGVSSERSGLAPGPNRGQDEVAQEASSRLE